MSIRPVDNQVAMTRTPEVTADRVRDIRLTGLTTGTLNEIVRDTEEDLRTVKDKSEIEMLRVRADEERKNAAGQEKKDKDENRSAEEDEGLRCPASELLLNLPVTSRGKELVSKRFDIRV